MLTMAATNTANQFTARNRNPTLQPRARSPQHNETNKLLRSKSRSADAAGPSAAAWPNGRTTSRRKERRFLHTLLDGDLKPDISGAAGAQRPALAERLLVAGGCPESRILVVCRSARV